MGKTDPTIITLWREWDDADPDHTETYHMVLTGDTHHVYKKFLKRSFTSYINLRRHLHRFADSDAVML